jgi:hypothetical protein
MTAQRGPTRSQIAQEIVAELESSISADEFIQRILARFPSKSKNPVQSIRSEFRYELPRLGMVFLDHQTLIPLRLALRGVRFRIPLDREQVKHGAIWQEAFAPFFKSIFNFRTRQEPPTLLDGNLQPIPAKPIEIAVKPARLPEDDFFAIVLGNDLIQVSALEISGWLRQHTARPGDSLLATVIDWEHGQIQLEYEPRAKRREAEIKVQNRISSDMIYALLQETVDERLLANDGIAAAYARLTSTHDYPGDHWRNVLETDKRMRNHVHMIVPADYLSPFDSMLEPDQSIKEQPYSNTQAQKVYRFQAQATYAKKKCVIEVLGKTTLKEFDRSMRAAFDLDSMDHLSEFTRIVRRGAGKRPHETPYGTLNPFERTPAAKVHIAGLGLEIGAELQYVYDFGDWVEHRLILESVEQPAADVKYPCISDIPAAKRGRRAKTIESQK